MKKENKKKVVTLSAMAALLAVVLGMGGKTYAKYFASAEAPADVATVAKFGYVVKAEAKNIWGSVWYDSDTDVATLENPGAAKAVVQGTSNKVAPGTSGSMSFQVTGQAEVATKIEFTVSGTDVSLSDGDAAKAYYPIKWTLTDTVSSTVLVNGGKLSDVIDEIDDLNNAYVAPGTSINYQYSLTWTWAFHVDGNTTVKNLDTTADDSDVLTYDEADTILGNKDTLAASEAAYTINNTVDFDFAVEVTQVVNPA